MAILTSLSRMVSLSSEARVSLTDLLALHRQRKALAALDDRGLRDIGLTPYDAAQEVSRSIFDVPHNWRA